MPYSVEETTSKVLDERILTKLEEGSKGPSCICCLRKSMLHTNNDNNGHYFGGLASIFVTLFRNSLNDFEIQLSKNRHKLSDLPETERLFKLLNIHARFCQHDHTLAEEIGREGSHLVLLRIIQLEICSAESDAETNQDTLSDLQDLACSISASYGGTFPMRIEPFALSEIQQRMPLKFDIVPIRNEKSAKGLHLHESILVQQLTKRQGGQEDVGFVMWPSAVLLARWILSNPSILEDSNVVLEIGAGCGLVGLLAGKQKQKSKRKAIDQCISLVPKKYVILSDFNPQVIDNLRRNIALNDLCDVCTTSSLDFYQQTKLGNTNIPETEKGWTDMNGNYNSPVDVIIGADVICQPSDAEAVACTIYNALRPGGKAYVVCATSAHRYGIDHFPTECQNVGLHMQIKNVSNICEDSSLQEALKLTTGYVQGMELTMFNLEKPIQNNSLEFDV